MKPTQPQQTILDAIFNQFNPQQNFTIYGVPGAGKTALLSMLSEKFSAMGKQTVALTFSHDLAESMLQRLPDATVKTTHAYMLQCLKNFLQLKNIRPQVVKRTDGQKDTWGYSYIDKDLLRKTVYKYLKQSYGLLDTDKVKESIAKEFYGCLFDIISTVDKIRTRALNYKTQTIEIHTQLDATMGVEIVDDALKILATLSDRFFLRAMTDFQGLLYLPIVHEELQNYIPSPEILLVDETNDTTPLLDSAYRIVGRNSLVIFVGDEKQTIHIWAGAKPDCMKVLSQHFQTKTLSYNYTFRVPKVMCEYLQRSQIDTRITPYASNGTGKIEQVSYNKFLSKVFHGDIVLCRYNRGKKVKRTLQAISIDLLKMRRNVAFHGSTHIDDIKELLELSQPLPTDFSKIKSQVDNAVKNAIAEEYIAKGLTKDNWRCETLKEKLETFNLYFDYYNGKTLIKRNSTVKDFLHTLESMYVHTDNAVQLYSIHRSKGLEAKKVYIFHTEALVADVENETATIDTRVEAHNLLLVALTRSLDETYLVDCQLPQLLPTPEQRQVV